MTSVDYIAISCMHVKLFDTRVYRVRFTEVRHKVVKSVVSEPSHSVFALKAHKKRNVHIINEKVHHDLYTLILNLPVKKMTGASRGSGAGMVALYDNIVVNAYGIPGESFFMITGTDEGWNKENARKLWEVLTDNGFYKREGWAVNGSLMGGVIIWLKFKFEDLLQYFGL